MRHLVVATLLVLSTAGCDYDPGGRCVTSRDCFPDQVCAAGLCAAEGEPPPNQPPAATADAYATPVNVKLHVVAANGLLANDADPDGDPLSAVQVTPAAHGEVYVWVDGTFDYEPNLGFTGSDTFAYQANDGVLRSDVTTVTLTVGP